VNKISKTRRYDSGLFLKKSQNPLPAPPSGRGYNNQFSFFLFLRRRKTITRGFSKNYQISSPQEGNV
jgi:hypothetical protein